MLGEMLSQDGVRLPGDNRICARKRAEEEGVEVEDMLYQRIVAYANPK